MVSRLRRCGLCNTQQQPTATRLRREEEGEIGADAAGARGLNTNPNDAKCAVLGEQLTAGMLVTAGMQECFALIFGLAAYIHLAVLQNPCNDADDMRAFLIGRGFKVIVVLDATHAR